MSKPSKAMLKALKSIKFTDQDTKEMLAKIKAERAEHEASAKESFEITAIRPEKRAQKRVLAWQLIEGESLPPGVWQAGDGTYLYTFMFGTSGIEPGCWVVELDGDQMVYDDEHFQALMEGKTITREEWEYI